MAFGQAAAALDKVPADTVELRRDIAFSQIRSRGAGGAWMSVLMELSPNFNPDPNAKSREFLENVEIILHLGFDAPPGKDGTRQFYFYQARSKIGIIKAREAFVMGFFLPGHIVERDDLPREPQYWAVEIFVNGVAQEPSAKLAARAFRSNPDSLKNFVSKSSTESRPNDGLLMPQYLAPVSIVSSAGVDTTIPFIRLEGN
jgi:hypothetical protein